MARISNFWIFFTTITLLVILVVTASTIKITEEHENKLLYAMNSKIEYNAKRCYLENNCKEEMTLKELYTKNYLTEVVNPVTKEILDENITITYKDDIITINW